MIRVLYFAAIREEIGADREDVPPEGLETVTDLLEALRARDEAHARALAPERRVLAAVNQEHAGPDRALVDGDEVAFFPPVTGGSTPSPR